MTPKGIRIEDLKDNGVVAVNLPDILVEIQKGSLYRWSILYLEAIGHLGEGRSIPVFENQINNSERGLFIESDALNVLAKKFSQIIDITLIGSQDESSLRRYLNDQEMYESCDIVIEMIDSGYWEVFSKDESLIEKLAIKFKKNHLT